MEKESNGDKKPVWNKSSSNDDSRIRPIIGAAAWPGLSMSLGDDGASSSSTLPFSQNNEILPGLANGIVAPPSGQSLSGQNQRNEFASQSHDGARHKYQRNSLKNQYGNHYTHQSHGSRDGFAQPPKGMPRGGVTQPSRGTPGFIPPPPPPLFYYVPLHQPFHPFTGRPMVFPEWAPSMMYQPYHIPPFVESYPHVVPIQDSSLKINPFLDSALASRIRNQVHYYFSEQNLRDDEFLCKKMNDEGFVHIRVIADFKKLKALTDNIQVILNALYDSDEVELQGYEIRNRYNWREFVRRPE